jgi:alpha-tubulin suppressor-like RCC1 family protein
MDTPRGVGVLSVSCGGGHTLVLLESGEVLACGLNDCGQCGHVGASLATPTPVQGLPPDVCFVSAGNFHSLAVTAGGAGA